MRRNKTVPVTESASPKASRRWTNLASRLRWRGLGLMVISLVSSVAALVAPLRASDPENPRFVWVLGPILWNIPPERGGGQDKAIESYLKGLETARKLKGTVSDPRDPSWGEPELLMSLAWSNLNRATPDLNAANHMRTPRWPWSLTGTTSAISCCRRSQPQKPQSNLEPRHPPTPTCPHLFTNKTQ
jgi:hypothetical protein